MQTGALRQLDIKVKQCMYKRVPGYKIKHLCEKQGASLLLALCTYMRSLCGCKNYYYFKHYNN